MELIAVQLEESYLSIDVFPKFSIEVSSLQVYDSAMYSGQLKICDGRSDWAAQAHFVRARPASDKEQSDRSRTVQRRVCEIGTDRALLTN
jgi:hypothetical protein